MPIPLRRLKKHLEAFLLFVASLGGICTVLLAIYGLLGRLGVEEKAWDIAMEFIPIPFAATLIAAVLAFGIHSVGGTPKNDR